MRMTEQEARERCVYNHANWIDKMHEEKKSFIIVMDTMEIGSGRDRVLHLEASITFSYL